ncbi:conserved Plasmodium protein, unknown function [Plasmodium malariae]|uniref:Parasite-infected erythrocyte surface protein n=1 Tax=Plasmodium malariae TaxID=5858 RepID=A0A1D3TF29_PLAMA|nr:conserved Plasmodium protein, unknown function [Plasmodium malariae]SCP03552.1 conserved Plasmodium protein, unknown function [Plasmodium malariae]
MTFKKSSIIFLIFSYSVFRTLGKDNVIIRWNRESFLQNLKSKFINFIANKKGFDRNGWINMSSSKEKYSYIDLKVEKDTIICNEDNKVVEVQLVNQKVIKHTGEATYLELYLRAKNVQSNSEFNSKVKALTQSTSKSRYMPVTRIPLKKFAKTFDNRLFDAYEDNSTISGSTRGSGSGGKDGGSLATNFEGYLVCTKKDTNALLVPKKIDTVEFISPPWKVKVSVDFYKCPLSNFGRVFLITIIDQVNILMNNKRYFIWPIPLSSFSEVYDFHMAVHDSKKGKFCELERLIKDKSLQLNCPSWNGSYNHGITNALLLSAYMGMASIQGISYILTKNITHHDIRNCFIRNKNSSSDCGKTGAITLQDYNKFSSEDENKQQLNETHEDSNNMQNQKLKRANILSNVVFVCLSGLSNVLYGIKLIIQIIKNLENINKDFDKALLFYPWVLKYPKTYFHSSATKFEENNIYNIMTGQSETEEKIQDHNSSNDEKESINGVNEKESINGVNEKESINGVNEKESINGVNDKGSINGVNERENIDKVNGKKELSEKNKDTKVIKQVEHHIFSN